MKGFAPEPGPKPRNWGRKGPEMDQAPSKQGDTVWRLLVGHRLGQLAVVWAGVGVDYDPQPTFI